MTTTITTTATLTASGTVKAGELLDFLRQIPREATVSVTTDTDRNMTSTTYRASWTPEVKTTRGTADVEPACDKPIQKCIDAGAHEVICRCISPVGHDGPHMSAKMHSGRI